MANGLVSFDEASGELRSVPDAFDERGLSVLSIIWRPGIDTVTVGPGTAVADVQWEDNTREAIEAPEGCSGTVSSVNRNITFENLPFAPSQWLMIVGQS